MADDIQHGLDDNPSGDPEKGAALGGLGGAAVGAVAGSMVGPVGTLLGAVAGGLLGAGASGMAVGAVDQVDNDNTVTGVGTGASENIRSSSDAPVTGTAVGDHNVVTGGPATTEAGNTGLVSGALIGGVLGTAVGGPVGAVVGGTLGSLAGGVAGDATEVADDTAADNNYAGDAFRAGAVDNSNPVLAPTPMTDYRGVDTGLTSVGVTDVDADMAPLGGLSTPGVRVGNDVPGAESGGVTSLGNETRGINSESAAGLTGDDRDDKTSGTVLNDPAR